MDLETSQVLKRLTELTEENNKILLKIQRNTRWGIFFGILKWVLFIALTIGSYVAIEPYINQTINAYQVLEHLSN